MLIIERFLSCDECGKTYGVYNQSFPSKLLRKLAHDEGWVNQGRYDYCPECYEKSPVHIRCMRKQKKDEKG